MADVPMFLRGALGLLGLFFAYMGGRAAAAVAKGRMRSSRLFTWIARILVCSVGVAIRHPIDALVIGVWAAEAVAFGGGYLTVMRQKPPEDLSREIFPE